MTTKSKDIPLIGTLDFNWSIELVNGKKSGKAKDLLIHCFQTARITGISPEKAIDWAGQLSETGTIMLDKADGKKLKNWLTDEDNNVLSPIAIVRFIEWYESKEEK